MRDGAPKSSRRNVLKASVGGAAVPFALTAGAAGREALPVVEQYRGTWENPLDVDRMMQVKRRAVDRHVELGGTPPDYYVDARPGFPDDAKLVDYVVGVQPNGVPTQHVGVAGGPGDVPGLHREADAKVREVRAKARGDR